MKIRKIISIVLIITVLLVQNEKIYAQERDEYQDKYVTSTSKVYAMVIANGVNLRKEPVSNSTILEKMYYGEQVIIDFNKSTAVYYYVKRLKTGTSGYASSNYIKRTGTLSIK